MRWGDSWLHIYCTNGPILHYSTTLYWPSKSTLATLIEIVLKSQILLSNKFKNTFFYNCCEQSQVMMLHSNKLNNFIKLETKFQFTFYLLTSKWYIIHPNSQLRGCENGCYILKDTWCIVTHTGLIAHSAFIPVSLEKKNGAKFS